MSFEGWKFFGVRRGKREDDDPKRDIKLLRLTGRAERRLEGVFQEETQEFLDRRQHVFVDNPLFRPNKSSDVFVIESFPFPTAFSQAIEQWQTWDDLEPSEIHSENVKAIMGVYLQEDSVRYAAFKKLDKSKVLDQESVWLNWSRNTLDVPDGPAIALPAGLSAVFSGETLYFENYHTTNGLLNLTPYFRESTTEEIDTLFETGPIKWVGKHSVHETVSQRCKRLMYLFNKAGGFENERMTPTNIKDRAAVINLNLELGIDGDGREVLSAPSSSSDVTKLFKLLTHHYYPGIWDDVWRETDSMQIVPGTQGGE